MKFLKPSFERFVSKCPSGYRVDFLLVASDTGDALEIKQEDFDKLQRKYFPHQFKEAKSLGIGDVVASIAQPIAKVIDFVAGTDLQNCNKCQQRKEALNKISL